MSSQGQRKRSKITDEQILVRYGTMPVDDIAEKLGVSRVAVMNRAKKLGITWRQKRQKFVEEVKKQQGEEIVNRAEEFKSELKALFNSIERDIRDYQDIERHIMRTVEQQAQAGQSGSKALNRSLKELFKVKDMKHKRWDSIMVLLLAFIESDLFNQRKSYESRLHTQTKS